MPAAESAPACAAGRAYLRAQQEETPRWVAAPGFALPLDPRREHSFLVHQARFHVGDTLWLTPLLRALRRRFPRSRTTVVGPPAALALLHDNPHVAEVLPYEPQRDAVGEEATRRQVLERLAGRRFDASLFAFARRRESRWLAQAAAEAGAPWRINLEYFDPALDSRRIPRWLTHEGWFFWGSQPSPRMLLHALDPLLGPERPAWTEDDRRLDHPVTERARQRAAAALANWCFGGEPFAVIAPGGLSSLRWSAERFARLAARLAVELGLHVLVEGSPAESAQLAEIAARGMGIAASTASRGRRIVAAADPLDVFAALLAQARLLVANDSAAIHLAEAAGTPTLYFAQREKLVHSHPAGPACWALYDEVANDPRRITVEQAMAALQALISRRCGV